MHGGDVQLRAHTGVSGDRQNGVHLRPAQRQAKGRVTERLWDALALLYPVGDREGKEGRFQHPQTAQGDA